MMFGKTVFALLVSAVAVSGFTSQQQPKLHQSTALNMGFMNEDGLKKAAVSAVAATFLLSNVLGVDPVNAADTDFVDFGSTEIVAARSGGRAGGRVSRGGPSSSYRAPPVTNTRTIERTTIVQPSVVSPSVVSPVYVAPVYNPMPGLGLGLGLNAINQIGNDMRDYRQESEIQRSRAELEQAKIREAELSSRLSNLEAAQRAQMYQQYQQPQYAPQQPVQ